ncbi:type IV pilus modification PilV family protein [Terrisporobacter sp.]
MNFRMKKLKSNSGISLIEMLVSLVILSISILTITNIVKIGINTNRKSEIKQQGLILGEHILEGVQLLGNSNQNISNITDSKITLFIDGNNQEITRKGSRGLNYNSKIIFNKIEYEVEISLNKIIEFDNSISSDINLNFKTEKINNENLVSIFKDNIEIAKNINPSLISVKVINDKINKNNLIYINDNEEKNNPIASFEGNKVMFNLQNKGEDEINIDVYNNLESGLNLYIQESLECRKKVNIQNRQGNLNLIEDISDLEESKIQDLYEIKVCVKKNNNVIFQSYADKNLKINK